VTAVIAGDRPLATLRELQTVYSLEDLYDLLEVKNVEAYNRRLIDKANKKELELANSAR